MKVIINENDNEAKIILDLNKSVDLGFLRKCIAKRKDITKDTGIPGSTQSNWEKDYHEPNHIIKEVWRKSIIKNGKKEFGKNKKVGKNIDMSFN